MIFRNEKEDSCRSKHLQLSDCEITNVPEKSFSFYFCLEFFKIYELLLIILKTIDFEAVDSLKWFILPYNV